MALPQTQPTGLKLSQIVRGEVQDLLDRLARALIAGDGDTVAGLYEVPALVVDAEGVIAVQSHAQIAEFFGAAQQQYATRGVVDTRADLIDLERIGNRLVIASVRWPYLDEHRREIGAEASDYTLRRDDHGRLRIRVVLMRGVEPPRA